MEPLDTENQTSDQRRKRILLVDDEELVRGAASAMLDMLGYDCEAVESGAAAQRYVRAHGDAIDLVMLDLNMPEMDGVDCFRALRTIAPSLPIVIISGLLCDDSRIRELANEGLRGMIEKPFTMGSLERDLAALLPRR